MRRHSSGRLFARNCSCWQACGREGCTTILYAQGTHPAAIHLRRSGVLYRSPSCAHAHRHARVRERERGREREYGYQRTYTDRHERACVCGACTAQPDLSVNVCACESLDKILIILCPRCALHTHAPCSTRPQAAGIHDSRDRYLGMSELSFRSLRLSL
jgi:hypothetical protein